MFESDNYWLQNSPTLNRGTPWRLTRHICDPTPIELEAVRYRSIYNYLPGDYVNHDDNPNVIYVCVVNCDQHDPYESQTDYKNVYWHMLDGVSYKIEEKDFLQWPELEYCQPIDATHYPSPSFFPPDPIAVTPGGYGCRDGYVFECMYERCNDPYLLGLNFVWFDATIEAREAFLDSILMRPIDTNVPDVNNKRNWYYRDTTKLVWRQVKKLAPRQPVKVQEDCRPWTPGQKFKHMDLTCTRTTVFICKDSKECSK